MRDRRFRLLAALVPVAITVALMHWQYSNLNICYENSGFAFGVASGGAVALPVLVSMGIIMALGVYLKRNWTSLNDGALAAFLLILIGGGINLVDRMLDGAVCDYIDPTRLVSWSPIFNIPDMLITVGIVYLLFINKGTSE